MSDNNSTDFLTKLSAYNIDQPGAISSPNNWNQVPLLEVEHGIYQDDFVNPLVDDLLSETEKGKWLFITGSPGNGKSAFCGKLHRKIKERDTHDFKFDAIEGELPFLITYTRKGEKYDTLRIIQDATVIAQESIFSPEPNEGEQLYSNIREAYIKGKSLVVCANNGIIQQTQEHAEHLEGDSVDSELKTILKQVTESAESKSEDTYKIKSSEKKKLYSEITVVVKKQDIESLLINKGNSEASPLSLILNKVIDDENWKSCSKCQFNDLCPWYLNKTDFKNTEIKENFIKQLRRMEVLLGQILPFRSLLSIVSNFFGGIKFGTKHPCEFVQERIQKEDFFTLIKHRFYQKFHSFGKDLVDLSFIKIPKDKSDFLDSMIKLASDNESRRTLSHLTKIGPNNSNYESISSGLFDKNGIQKHLDLRFSDFSEISDITEFSLDNFESLRDYNICHALESKIIDIFIELDEAIGSSYLGNNNVENLRMLREWSKDFSIPLYSFEKDQPLNKITLDKFIQICKINYDDRDPDTTALKIKLEKEIPIALEYLKDSPDQFFPIGSRFEVDGIANISFKIRKNPKNKLTFGLYKENDHGDPLITIDAKKFIWFNKIYEKKLLNWSVPQVTEEEIKEFKEKIGASIDLIRSESFKIRLERLGGRNVKKKIILKKDSEDGISIE